MQDVSALYIQLLSQLNHHFDVKIVIDGTEYFEDTIVSLKTTISVFKNGPEVGGTPSQEIDCVLRNPGRTFPRMAELKPYVRAVGFLDGVETVSEWIPQGVFYSDTRKVTDNDGGIVLYTIHGFDSMLKAEQHSTNWFPVIPGTDVDVLNFIASKIGVEVDPRTYDIMIDHYYFGMLPSALYPYSFREVLSFIAAKYLGFFYITDQGKLLLQTLLSLPDDAGMLINELGNNITFGGTRILV